MENQHRTRRLRGNPGLRTDETSGPVRYGLFVLWQNSRCQEERILADLRERFEFISVQEVYWSPHLVERNYERFYSDLDLRGVYHVFNKGAGPFLAVRVFDRNPVMEERLTSRGVRMVNGNFLDAKLRFREWLGGIGVHCGETGWESRRDLRMLLGIGAAGEAESPAPWNGDIGVLGRDVTGAHGWESAQDAISALNVGANYVVLGDPASWKSTSLMGGARRTLLLTDQYHAVHTVLNARPLLGFPPPHGGSFSLSIAGQRVIIRLRVVGDGFLDPNWARECLSMRTFNGDGVYRPSAQDTFATFCYGTLVHSPRLTAEDRAAMQALADRLGLAGWSRADFTDPRLIKERLDGLLAARGIFYVMPRDPTIFVNFRALGLPWPVAHRLVGAVSRLYYSLSRGLAGYGKTRYLRMRDWALRHAPGIKRLKAAVVGLGR